MSTLPKIDWNTQLQHVPVSFPSDWVTDVTSKPFVDVRSFGATGDGSTDDTAAIQAAINASPGRFIYFPKPPVFYRVNSGPLVVPVNVGGTAIPYGFVGEGYDNNGGVGSSIIKNTGSSHLFSMVSASGSADQLFYFGRLSLLGDGQNIAGGDGIHAVNVSGLVIEDCLLNYHRGSGLSLNSCLAAKVRRGQIFSNRVNGVVATNQCNRISLEGAIITYNGKIYSQQCANVSLSAASLDAVFSVRDCDLSNAGNLVQFTRAGATLTSIVVSTNVATATTSTAHGIIVGNVLQVSGATVAPNLNATYPYTVASTPTSTTLTFTTSGVADGTYTESTLRLGPSSSGLLAVNMTSVECYACYIEDCADCAIYLGSGISSFSADMNWISNCRILVDSATAGRISLNTFNGAVSKNLLITNGTAPNAITVFGNTKLSGATFSFGTSYVAEPVVSYGTVSPASGTWPLAAIVYNTNPTSSGFIGWVCTAAGTPGTWKTFGLIS